MDTTLSAFFVVFAVIGALTFLYALRSLGPAGDAERRLMELQARYEEGEE